MAEQGIDVEALSINPLWYTADRDVARKLIAVQNEKLAEVRARKRTGKGVSATVRHGLELVAASEAYEQLRALRGKGRVLPRPRRPPRGPVVIAIDTSSLAAYLVGESGPTLMPRRWPSSIGRSPCRRWCSRSCSATPRYRRPSRGCLSSCPYSM